MKKTIFLLVVLFSSIAFAEKYADYEGIAWNLNKNGEIDLYKSGNYLGSIGLYITSNEYTISPHLFQWAWNVSIKNVTVISYDIGAEKEYNISYLLYNITGKLITAKTEVKRNIILDKYHMNKITDTITNKAGDLTNYKLWYVFTFENPGEKIYFDGKTFSARQDLSLNESLSTAAPKIQIGNAYTFLYLDLLNENFQITDLKIGKPSLHAFDKRYKVMLGTQINNGKFKNKGTIIYDPQLTGWKFPSSIGSVNEWTNSNNIKTDNANVAEEDTIGHRMEQYGYSFNIPDGSTINGIYVSAECRAGGRLLPAKSRAYLGINLSWNGGTTYTSDIKQSWLWGSGTSYEVKYYGNYTHKWGRSWTVDEMNSSNFYTKIAYTSGLANFNDSYLGTDGGCDYVAVDVNYTAPEPNCTINSATYHSESFVGADGGDVVSAGTIGSSYYIKMDCDQIIDDCTITLSDTAADTSHCAGDCRSADDTCTIDDDGYGFEAFYTVINGTQDFFSSVGGWSGGEYQEDGGVLIYMNSSNNNTPAITDFEPPDTTVGLKGSNVTINFTINDSDRDWMSYSLIVDDNTTFYDLQEMEGSPVHNDTYQFVFSMDPDGYNASLLYVGYHLNNESSIGENDTLVVDEVGRFNGTVTNPDGVSNGKFGNAWLSDSTISSSHDNMIKIGYGFNFSDVCTNGCTFSVYMYPKDDADYDVLSRWDASGSNMFFKLSTGSGGIVRFTIGMDGATRCEAWSVADYVQNQWQILTGVYNAVTNTTYVYVDGNLKDSTACGSSFIIDESAWEDSEETLIGCSDYSNDDTCANPFNGSIDHVHIWNRSLSSTEVKNLYKLRNNTKYYWNLTVRDYKLDTDDNISNEIALETLDNGWFMFGDQCICSAAGCEIDCSLNCTFLNAIDLHGTPIIGINPGTVTWKNTITNGSRFSFDTGCKFAFEDRFEFLR